MSRLFPLLFLLVLSCENTSETAVASFDNDYISGIVGDREFRIIPRPGAVPMPYYETYNIDSITSERDPDTYFLVLRRTDAAVSELIEFSIPLDPLYESAYPITSLAGGLSFADLQDDSTAGCPHIDSSSWETIPVSITVESWTDNELVGQFFSQSAQSPGQGEFSFLIAK